jgi:CBS domain-containing protein
MTVPIAAILQRKGRDVQTIAPDAPVVDAVSRLEQHNIGALVVSTDGETVAGILSERDVVRELARSGTDCLDRRVSDLMTAEVTTCSPAESADDVMATMTAGRIRHIPVLEDGKMVGIVSIGDVVKSRIDDLETQAESLQHYVTGSSY